MTTICVVQARFDSSRLPGKVLEPIGGVPILLRILDRLRLSKTVDEVIVATTRSSSDDPIVQLAEDAGVAVIRGSAFDVLDRFHDVLVARPDADVIVRVTADCPVVDPYLVDVVVRSLTARGVDYAANRLPPPYARTFPVGLDVEVCTARALTHAWENASESYMREHVTPYLYVDAGRFATHIVDWTEDLSHYRWTVDTPRDLEAMRQIYSYLRTDSTDWQDVLDVVRAHPSIDAVNADEAQKVLEQVDSRWVDTSS